MENWLAQEMLYTLADKTSYRTSGGALRTKANASLSWDYASDGLVTHSSSETVQPVTAEVHVTGPA